MLKKIFKRLICLCFLFISFGFVNAYAGPSDGSGITLVAEISIHSFGSKYYEEAGHSFLTIKNTGSRAIYVGKMYVSSGKTVSIGNWGNLGEHSGLWYNMETYYDSINRYDTVDIVSLSAVLDSEELNTVNNYINSNDYWTKEYNCTTFAAEAWNLISSYTFTFSGTPYPINLSNQIKKYNYQTNKNLDYNMPTGYYDGDNFVERIGYHI